MKVVKKILSLYMVAFLVCPSIVIAAEADEEPSIDTYDVVPIEAGDPAPFDGILLSFEAAAKMAVDKKFEDAIGHYRTVLEINPEHSNAYAYWGTSLSALGKLEEAVSKLEESLMLNRFNSQAYEILIDVLYQQQKYERAWEMVHKAQSDNVSLQQSFIDRLSKVFSEPAQNP